MRETTALELAARSFDLERRVALLETMLHTHSLPKIKQTELLRFYMDAHSAPGDCDTTTARAWVRQLYLLDVCALLSIGRLSNDPFPWRPFLAMADRCCARGIPEALDARDHLLSCSTDLLAAMGLELLEPRDVMAQLQLREALTRLETAPR